MITESDTLTMNKSVLQVSRTMHYLQDKAQAWKTFCMAYFGPNSYTALEAESWITWIDKHFNELQEIKQSRIGFLSATFDGRGKDVSKFLAQLELTFPFYLLKCRRAVSFPFYLLKCRRASYTARLCTSANNEYFVFSFSFFVTEYSEIHVLVKLSTQLNLPRGICAYISLGSFSAVLVNK